MKEKIISLKLAKILKEKGFDVECDLFYVEYLKTNKSDNPSFCSTKGEITLDRGYFVNNQHSDLSNTNYICYAACSQALIQQWLREKYNIQTYVISHTLRNDIYSDYCGYINNSEIHDARDKQFDKYENCMEETLIEAMKLIKK